MSLTSVSTYVRCNVIATYSFITIRVRSEGIKYKVCIKIYLECVKAMTTSQLCVGPRRILESSMPIFFIPSYLVIFDVASYFLIHSLSAKSTILP